MVQLTCRSLLDKDYGLAVELLVIYWIDNYVVEASVPTIILFSVIRKDVGNLYKWLMFRPKGPFIRARLADVSAQRPSSEPNFASGSDEGLWAETSAIYITYQHLCGLH